MLQLLTYLPIEKNLICFAMSFLNHLHHSLQICNSLMGSKKGDYYSKRNVEEKEGGIKINLLLLQKVKINELIFIGLLILNLCFEKPEIFK